MAYRLYLPKNWAEGQARRDKGDVPAEINFTTKPEIALDQTRHHAADGGSLLSPSATKMSMLLCDEPKTYKAEPLVTQ